MLKPVCNNKRCPGKTCEGEKAGKSFYATKGGQGCCWPVWHVYDAFRAGTKVALKDLVAMGVRELDGRDPTTQVDVERDDLLKYTGRIGLCGTCTPRTPGGKETRKKKKSGHNCSDPFKKGCKNPDPSHKKQPCPDCQEEEKRRKAAAAS